MLRKLNLLMLLCISIFIVSCSSDVEDKTESKNASTFSLSSVEKVSSRSFSDDPSWPELKNKSVTDLKVCILDKVYQDSINGAKFSLSTEKNSTDLVSDIHGCITWQEEIDFDYTADESFVLVEGTIEGADNFKGMQDIRFGINPWTGEVVDLLKGGTVGKIVTENSVAKKNSHQNQINFTNATVDIQEINFVEGYSTNIMLETSIKPFLKRKNIDGTSTEDEYFTNGEFELDFLLIQKEYGSSNKSILAETNSKNRVDENGVLVSPIYFEIKKEIKPNSTIELAIRATPVGQVKRIGNIFNSLVLESIHGRKKYEVNPASYTYSQVKKLSEEKEDYSNSAITTHGFVLSKIKGSYINEDGVANGDFTSSLRERKASLEINLVDTFLHKGTNGKFEISVYDTVEQSYIGQPFTKETDPSEGSGLITHTINFPFDENFEYDYRKYIVKVTGVSGIYRGITQQRAILVNPRVKNGFLIDYEDTNEGKDLGIGQEIKARIHFNEYDLSFEGNSDSKGYKLNKNLDLLGYRKMTITVKPKVRVDHNYANGNTDMELPNSLYKVKFMVLTPKNPLMTNYDRNIDLDDFYVLTGAELDTVKGENGLMSATMDFPHLFVEKNLLAFKNIAVLFIEPVNKDSKIESGYHVGKVEIFKKFGLVKNLYDSRLEDATTIKLKIANQLLANKMKLKIKEFKYKLQEDREILNPFLSFKEDIRASNGFLDQVPVINHEMYRVENRDTKLNIADTENLFLEKYPELDLEKSDLEELFDTSRFEGHVGNELCKLFYDPAQKTKVDFIQSTGSGGAITSKVTLLGEEYKRCQRDTTGHLQIKELKFMNKITVQPGELKEIKGEATWHAETLTLGRNEAFFASRGNILAEIQGERSTAFVGVGNHTSLDISRKLLGGALSVFSALGPEIGFRQEYYKMSQKSDIDSNQRRIINQNGQVFHVSIYNVRFRAMVKRCFLIAPKYVRAEVPKARVVNGANVFGSLLDWFKERDGRSVVTSPIRHVVCKEFPVEEELSEKYYFVRLADTNNLQLEDLSMAKNSIGTVIRGEKAYNEFRELDLKNDKLILFQNDSARDSLRKYVEDEIANGRDPHKDKRIYMQDGRSSEVVRRYKYFMKQMGKDIKYKDRMGTSYPGLYEKLEK